MREDPWLDLPVENYYQKLNSLPLGPVENYYQKWNCLQLDSESAQGLEMRALKLVGVFQHLHFFQKSPIKTYDDLENCYFKAKIALVNGLNLKITVMEFHTEHLTKG